MRYIALIPVTLLAACGGGGSSTTAFQAGQWEMTTQVSSINVPNMPQGAQMPMPPPQTIRTCMTEAQAARPNADFLAGSNSSGCSSNNMSFENGRIQGTVTCAQPAAGGQPGTSLEMTMTGQYTPTTLELNQQVRTQQAGMNMEMQARTTGRRVGDCPST